MRLTRIHVDAPLAAGLRVPLSDAAAGHLVRVLRLKEGDACVLFNGDGRDYPGRVASIGKREVLVDVDEGVPLGNESPLRLTLLQGVARGEKMDWILQKATELGVAAVVPVESERSEVRLEGARLQRRVAHWRGRAGRGLRTVRSGPGALDRTALAAGRGAVGAGGTGPPPVP
jgi:16S rRNA (uracil1498-N3)-methyltransferase